MFRKKRKNTRHTDIALLGLRITTGSILAGHGAQKLFGWFGGHGMEATAGWLESTGLEPGKPWATAAGLSEFGGGLLMALGFLNPVGALTAVGAMSMATAKGHWNKPFWNQNGGPELPVTNAVVATAIALAGPGRYSLDNVFGIKLPRWLIVPGLLAAFALGAFGVRTNPEQTEQHQTDEQEQAA